VRFGTRVGPLQRNRRIFLARVRSGRPVRDGRDRVRARNYEILGSLTGQCDFSGTRNARQLWAI
jgi:hypothetical protein